MKMTMRLYAVLAIIVLALVVAVTIAVEHSHAAGVYTPTEVEKYRLEAEQARAQMVHQAEAIAHEQFVEKLKVLTDDAETIRAAHKWPPAAQVPFNPDTLAYSDVSVPAKPVPGVPATQKPGAKR